MTARSGPPEEMQGLLARCTFPAAGTPLVCGVSGGADSLALLVLAVAAGCEVTAVHVDHGLRPGSAGEADVVRWAAERRGAAFRSETVEVPAGPNLEARARAARHEVLGPRAALGHTADDRAETVLVNLLRGAGLDGLAGIRPGPRHPILGLRRADTEALCAAEGLVPVVDPTNADPTFLRNRVRHEVLPLLADVAGRDLVPVLDRQADLAGHVADHLRTEAATLDVTDAKALRAAPHRWRASPCASGCGPTTPSAILPTRPRSSASSRWPAATGSPPTWAGVAGSSARGDG